MFLLDTNVLSELRRPERADRNVARWSSGISVTQVFISAISLLEIERGALRVARKDVAQGKVLRVWIDGQLLIRFDGRILPVDAAVALQCAKLHIPDPKPERDALIAATALMHGLTMVTRNVDDFSSTGVRLLNPWDAQ
jgi:hypothetical protein